MHHRSHSLWIWGLIGALLLAALPTLARTVYAHAVLVRSEPAANARLSEAPHEIRLWFTEPLEPTYSSIELRDATGAVVNTPPSYVDPTDHYQLVLMADELGEGLYTVVWRNVSSADGHRQTGSFAFAIGAGSASTSVAAVEDAALTGFDLLARWVNFVGLALAAGSVAFVVFVWRPATHGWLGQTPRALWVVVWVGWLLAGVGAVLLLINQAAILLNQPWRDVLTVEALVSVVRETRFGTLLLWRMALWGLMALLLMGAGRVPWLAWLATVCGLAMLLPMSLHSHAAVSEDLFLSIFSDWVHLTMTALWVGGLVQCLVAIPALRAAAMPVAPKVGALVAHFSNYARLTVAALIVTGLYATWHQVNTLEALTTTFYGQLLIAKLALALLLLAVACVNMLLTQRRLLAGHALWVGRLRALVGVEVLLLLAILALAGGMTAINPARNEIAQRAAAAAIPPAPEPQPIHQVQDADDLQIHFTAMPGWVGNSTFTVQLVDEDGAPITDASLIRMRFEHQTENLGESEVQIRPEGEAADGVYTIEGANLSTVGAWSLRMTVQRPGEFDSIADFEFEVIAPPAPPPMPVVESDPMPANRTPALLTVGICALLAGVWALVQQRFRLRQGATVLASLLLVLGAAFVVSGLLT